MLVVHRPARPLLLLLARRRLLHLLTRLALRLPRLSPHALLPCAPALVGHATQDFFVNLKSEGSWLKAKVEGFALELTCRNQF